MTKTKLHKFAESLLNAACPTDLPDEGGWSKYTVEAHCMEFVVVARKRLGEWEIRDVSSESV